MMYECEEKYSFNVDTEFESYKEFKRELKESGIPYHDLGGTKFSTIIIRTSGTFNKEPKS